MFPKIIAQILKIFLGTVGVHNVVHKNTCACRKACFKNGATKLR